MKMLSVKNIRTSILSIRNGENSGKLEEMTNEELYDCDFGSDLGMDQGQVVRLISELNVEHNLMLPREICKVMTDNKVRSFIDTVNMYIKETASIRHLPLHVV